MVSGKAMSYFIYCIKYEVFIMSRTMFMLHRGYGLFALSCIRPRYKKTIGPLLLFTLNNMDYLPSLWAGPPRLRPYVWQGHCKLCRHTPACCTTAAAFTICHFRFWGYTLVCYPWSDPWCVDPRLPFSLESGYLVQSSGFGFGHGINGRCENL